MTHMITAHAHEVDLRHPRPGALTAAVVAHHLAQINRFVGACRRPYSVAEHSLLVSYILEQQGHGIMIQLAGLLHDAHEAWIGDATTPVKQMLGAAWGALELPWAHHVRRAFGVVTAFAAHGAKVKRADMIALATERRDLLTMPADALPWGCLDGVEPLPEVDLMEPGRAGMAWHEWRDAFAARLEELEYARFEALGPMQ